MDLNVSKRSSAVAKAPTLPDQESLVYLANDRKPQPESVLCDDCTSMGHVGLLASFWRGTLPDSWLLTNWVEPPPQTYTIAALVAASGTFLPWQVVTDPSLVRINRLGDVFLESLWWTASHCYFGGGNYTHYMTRLWHYSDHPRGRLAEFEDPPLKFRLSEVIAHIAVPGPLYIPESD